MTTDELVAGFIEALKDGDLSTEEVGQAFSRYGAKRIVNDFDVEVWSIALNYDTRDVRFVQVDGGMGWIGEVRPEVKTDVRVEYVGA